MICHLRDKKCTRCASHNGDSHRSFRSPLENLHLVSRSRGQSHVQSNQVDCESRVLAGSRKPLGFILLDGCSSWEPFGWVTPRALALCSRLSLAARSRQNVEEWEKALPLWGVAALLLECRCCCCGGCVLRVGRWWGRSLGQSGSWSCKWRPSGPHTTIATTTTHLPGRTWVAC